MALIDPMDAEKKQCFFDLLVKVGLKEIEVGFPSASNTEYTFNRRLIEEKRVPEDVRTNTVVTVNINSGGRIANQVTLNIGPPVQQ